MIAPIRQDKRHHWVTKQSIGANKFEHSDDNTCIPDKPLSLLATMSIGVGCPYRGFLSRSSIAAAFQCGRRHRPVIRTASH